MKLHAPAQVFNCHPIVDTEKRYLCLQVHLHVELSVGGSLIHLLLDNLHDLVEA